MIFVVFSQVVADYGDERVLYVNSFNYLKKGRRSDTVEVELVGEPNCPADILFIMQRVGQIYLLVRFYEVETQCHPVMGVPVISGLQRKTDPKSYMVIEPDQIAGHAHLIPDFDRPQYFWWDHVKA